MAVVNFPTRREARSTVALDLPAQLVEQWRTMFPRVNLNAELSRAEDWCAANLKRRKPASAQQRFVEAWLRQADADAVAPDRPQLRLVASYGHLLNS